MTFEAKIITFLQAGMNEGWTVFFKTVSLFGSFLGAFILFLVLFIFDKRFSIVYAITYGVGVGINALVKRIIGRARPFESYEAINALTDATGGSMPSGHAVSITIMAIFVIFAVLIFVRKKAIRWSAIITAILVVGLVCLSRMCLGVHYLTDVVAGVALGILISLAGFFVELKLLEKKFGGGSD